MNREVVDMAAKTFPIFSGTMFLDLLISALVGTLRGFGKQNIGAAVCFVGTYLLNLPVGLLLAFEADLSISGLWWGFIVGLIAQAIVYIIYLLRMNWQDACECAREEAGVVQRSALRSYSVSLDPETLPLAKHRQSRTSRTSQTFGSGEHLDYRSMHSVLDDDGDLDDSAFSDDPSHITKMLYGRYHYEPFEIRLKVFRAFFIYAVLICLLAAAFVYQYSYYQHDHDCFYHNCTLEDSASSGNSSANSTVNATAFSTTATATTTTTFAFFTRQ